MISSQSAMPVYRRTGRPASYRLLLVILLASVLAACQSTQSALPDDEGLEELAIIVSPIGQDSGDVDGETVRGTVVVSVPTEGWIKEVRFFVDGERRHTVTSAPFEYMLDTTLLADGPHLLAVEARMANGRVRVSESATFTVSNESAPTAPDPDRGMRVSPSLRGDPSFDAASLSDDVALWYGRLWHEIDHGSFDPIAVAGRDCIYQYGRTLHTYIQSVLVAFRLTGDLALLDHIDEIAERMRAQLRDEWRGTLDGTDGTRDGYLNWVDRHSSGTYRGKDTMRVNEIKTHALVAMMAYALEANRDLPSPGGRNYAAHADFWRDYLVNHFEAKWRERHGVPTAFPIMTRPGTHTYHSWIKWHYYMGLLTGNNTYTNEAHRMADNVWADLRPIETATGTAYVWAGSIGSAGGSNDYLQRTTYARYVYGDMIEFHLEGFHNWASTSQMKRFARTFTTFVIDRADPLRDGFAPDVGGRVTRAGLESGDPSRLTVDSYRESSYPLMAAWDTTGRIQELNEAVYASIGSRSAAWLTAGSMLNASWTNDSFLASGRLP